MSSTSLESKVQPRAVADDYELGSDILKHELKQTEHVPAGHISQSAEEKALNRALNMKLDICLLPFLSLL
jgi:hypothetical protein